MDTLEDIAALAARFIDAVGAGDGAGLLRARGEDLAQRRRKDAEPE